jgi:hypothetical protein
MKYSLDYVNLQRTRKKEPKSSNVIDSDEELEEEPDGE